MKNDSWRTIIELITDIFYDCEIIYCYNISIFFMIDCNNVEKNTIKIPLNMYGHYQPTHRKMNIVSVSGIL